MHIVSHMYMGDVMLLDMCMGDVMLLHMYMGDILLLHTYMCDIMLLDMYLSLLTVPRCMSRIYSYVIYICDIILYHR